MIPPPPQGPPVRRSWRPHPRHVRRAGIWLFASIGVYAGIIVALAYLFLHPLRFGIWEKPDALGLRYEDVKFPSATDHLTLHGWYMPADSLHPRGLILFCHGRQGNRSDALRHAAYLHKAGYALFAFDFRACGDSEGTMSTIGYQEVGDALGAVTYLESRRDTRGMPLGIFGVSMGAAVALQTTVRAPEIRCVIADSPFATLDSAVRRRFDALFGAGAVALRLPVERVGEEMMGVDALSVSPLAAMPKIAPRPIFLIHGDADMICDVNDSRALYKAATPGTAQLWIVEGAGHVGSYSAKPKEYRRRVLTFLNDSFPVR